MPLDTLRRWLGLQEPAEASAQSPLRDVLESLDHLEPRRARHLARFAYLLGRVAHADQNISPAETRAMEALVSEQGGLDASQAIIVVGLARNAHLLFGGTADFEVAREFAEEASYEEKLALARCLFAVASTDEAISVAEESEIHRIATVLRIQSHDLTQLRVAHAAFLPGLAKRRD